MIRFQRLAIARPFPRVGIAVAAAAMAALGTLTLGADRPAAADADRAPAEAARSVAESERTATVAADSTLTLEPYVFVSAKGESVAAEWGVLRVPENRADPGSRRIELAFVRFKSTSESPGPPIVYLAGGPGNSGIAAARGTRFPLFMALRAVGDVIALDPRGVGASRPLLDCEQTEDYPLDQPGDRTQVVHLVHEKCRQCAATLHSQGTDLAGYTVDASADDVDDLRRALGAPSLSLWGISYGTTLGLDIIRRHGDRVHKAILAGTEGTDDMLKRPARVDSMLGVIATLANRDTSVAVDVPDMIGAMRAQLARLARAPIRVRIADASTEDPGDSVTVVLGAYDYQWAAYRLLGTQDYQWLPGFVWTVGRGDYRWWAGLVARERRSGIGSGLQFHTDCASGASPERRRQVTAERETAVLGDVSNYVYPDVCDAWGSPDLGEEFRRGVRDSRVPVLFISGSLDVRTPPVQADLARRGFRTSHHLLIDGAAHSDPLFLSSPKILDTMLEFLQAGTVSTTRLSIPIRFRPVREFVD